MSAATLYANVNTGIQAVVNQAQAGDTVIVAPGTYNEQVTINKSITLEGAQSGMDARSARGQESIVNGVNGSTAFVVAANNVVIDGFTISGNTNANVFGAGLYIQPGFSGTQITNDIIQDNIIGLFLENAPGGNQAVIQHDLFQNNNQTGPSSGTAIYFDQFTAGGAVSNVLISDNTFVGNNNAGLIASSTDTANPDTDFTITNNTFESNGGGLVLLNLGSSTIAGNTFTNSGTAIGLYGNDTNLSITGNHLTGGDGFGVQIAPSTFLGLSDMGPSSNVTVNNNDIHGFTQGAVDVETGGYTGTLDATKNWWGSASGPATGSITGPVNFTSFLSAPVGFTATTLTPGSATVTQSGSAQLVNVTVGVNSLPSGTTVNGGTVTVTLMQNGIPVTQASAQVSNGQATVQLPVSGGLPVGSYTLQESYSDTNGTFTGSSGVGTLTVAPQVSQPAQPAQPAQPTSSTPTTPSLFQAVMTLFMDGAKVALVANDLGGVLGLPAIELLINEIEATLPHAGLFGLPALGAGVSAAQDALGQ
ncbi:MAG TPA: right-handed parallel beta-helix repeat-containing protein [Gemmataceae bacterium]|jgi:parallel beta-helix repeat protein